MANETTEQVDDAVTFTPEEEALITGEEPQEAPETPETEAPETPAGDAPSAGSDTAQPETAEGEGEATAEDLAEYARNYGLAPEDVQGMTREDIDRAALLFDRKITAQVRAGQQPAREGAEAQPPAQTQQPKQEAQPTAEEPKPFALEWGEEGKDEYPEVVVKNLEAMAAEVAALRQALDSRQQADAELQQQAATEQFYQTLQGLVFELDPELFGDGKDLQQLTGQHWQNHQKLHDELLVLQAGLHAHGLDASLNKQLVERAYRLAFPDQITKKERQQFSEKVQKQAQRRGGAGVRPSGTAKPKVDEDMDLKDDPELAALYEELATT